MAHASSISGGYFQRLLPLVRSAASLNQVSFFQLVIAANRSLLEILVDVTHLHCSDPPDAAERIEVWEHSAKFKAAVAALTYARSRQKTSELLDSMAKLAERNQAQITRLRKTLWPSLKGKHPERWTGRNLGDDCKSADRLAGLGLEDFYEIQYRQMNWNVHGSGFAGVSSLDVSDIEILYGRALLMSGRFAFISTGMILIDLGLFHDELQEQFQEARSRWSSLIAGPLTEAGWSAEA